MGIVGYIRSPQHSIPLTDEDLLWAGRAAAREASSGLGWTAVLWSWAQRAIWYAERGLREVPCREQPGKPLTFTWTVRCHSQPVNDFWRSRGTPDQLRVRQYLQSPAATWESLESGAGPMQAKPGLKAHVYAWARGQLANPVPRLADFSAPGQPDVPAGSPTVGGNAFFPESGTTGWPADHVRITPAPVTASLFGGSWLVWLGVGAAVAAVALYLKARKAKTGNVRKLKTFQYKPLAPGGPFAERELRARGYLRTRLLPSGVLFTDAPHRDIREVDMLYQLYGGLPPRKARTANTKRRQPRHRRTGRYSYVMDKPCVCGHVEHTAEAPHECIAGDFHEGVVCDCERYRPARPARKNPPAPPEFASVEAFVEYLIEDERDSFTAEELGDLAYHLAKKRQREGHRPEETGASRNKLRKELEGYGLQLAKRAFEKRVRGVTADPHDRWYGLGSSPTHGGSGWEQISGFAGKPDR